MLRGVEQHCITGIGVLGSREDHPYDGWYNNLNNPSWGAAGMCTLLLIL